jgi:hypothetical protein
METSHTGHQLEATPFDVLAWGILWRTCALGMGCGLLLGMIYGALYPMLVLLNPSSDTSLDEAILGGLFLALFGSLIGAQFGCISGLVLGVFDAVLVCLLTYLAIRTNMRLTLYRLLAVAISFAPVGLGILLLQAWVIPTYTTAGSWAVDVGIPVSIATLAFSAISYYVGRWVAQQIRHNA